MVTNLGPDLIFSALLSGAKEIGEADTASPLMPINFRNELLERGFKLIEVPDEEFESMGCNVLAIAPRQCFMVAGNPITKELLEDAGCQVSIYKGKNISVKGGGGPTCLTRPMLRCF